MDFSNRIDLHETTAHGLKYAQWGCFNDAQLPSEKSPTDIIIGIITHPLDDKAGRTIRGAPSDRILIRGD